MSDLYCSPTCVETVVSCSLSSLNALASSMPADTTPCLAAPSPGAPASSFHAVQNFDSCVAIPAVDGSLNAVCASVSISACVLAALSELFCVRYWASR